MTAWVEMGDEAVCPLCGLVVDKPEAASQSPSLPSGR